MIEVAKKMSNANNIVLTALFVIQLALIVHPIGVILPIIIAGVSLLFFVFVKDFLHGGTKKTAFIIMSLTLLSLPINIVSNLFAKLKVVNPEAKIPFVVILFLGVIIVLMVATILSKDERRQQLKTFYDTDVYKKDFTKKKDPGDVVICKNIDTGKDVVIPFKDRFLHTLILGPTGSGKTSQIIIPMINQDLQNREAGITVIEPKGDLAEKVMALSTHYGREAVYFNPIDPDCPSFNPLYGDETEVIENIVTTFLMLSPGSSQYFLDMADTFLRNALKVVKRVKGDKATMNDLSILAHNSQSMGKEMVNELSRMDAKTTEIKKENDEVVSWFLTEYYNEKSKTYEHCSGVRNQIFKINANEHLRRVLNPPEGGSDMDFSRVLEEGGVLAISTAQGALRELGKYLGYFIILNLQSSVFKRSGNENTRRPHFLYIDEFQTYSNPGFADMLTQGRSYRVSSNLATQNRALIGMGAGREGQDFIELVSTNARNVIIFPGGNSKDAEYYSKEFGEEEVKRIQKSVSRPRFFAINPSGGWGNISEREVEQKEASFSASDIIYRQFGEIIYKIIQNNTLQSPGIGKVAWIDKDLNDKLDRMIEEHNQDQERKRTIIEKEKTLNINTNTVKNFDPLSVPLEDDSPRIKDYEEDNEDLRDLVMTHQKGRDRGVPGERTKYSNEEHSDIDLVNDIPIEDEFL